MEHPQCSGISFSRAHYHCAEFDFYALRQSHVDGLRVCAHAVLSGDHWRHRADAAQKFI